MLNKHLDVILKGEITVKKLIVLFAAVALLAACKADKTKEPAATAVQKPVSSATK